MEHTPKRKSLVDAFSLKTRGSASTVTPSRRLQELQEENHPSLTSNQIKTSTLVNVTKPTHSSKTFNDPIHGMHVEMESICLRIIDTPEFQRLRMLKQLGTCSYVYNGATHTRFEHSLGVAHLAERIVKVFTLHQPDLEITPTDVLCVKVAGLCHDLGHGPFSHVFDGGFMKRYRRGKKSWRHEDGSVLMLRHLIKSNNIDIKDYGLSDIDVIFIEEMISGKGEEERVGRPPSKHFLYDVVNNTRSGLDVDKIDYYLRDMQMVNVGGAVCNKPCLDRFIDSARVHIAEVMDDIDPRDLPFSQLQYQNHFLAIANSPSCDASQQSLTQAQTDRLSSSENTNSKSIHVEEGSPPRSARTAYMICFPEKLIDEAPKFFTTRFEMHNKVYTHRTVKKIEYMLIDALHLAEPHIKIPGSVTASHPDGMYRLSEVIEDPKAFSRLNDSILDVIRLTPGSELDPARSLIDRIHRRDLYKLVGHASYKLNTQLDRLSESQILRDIVDLSKRLAAERLAKARSTSSYVETQRAGVRRRLDLDSDRSGDTPKGKRARKVLDVIADTPYCEGDEDDAERPVTQDEYENELLGNISDEEADSTYVYKKCERPSIRSNLVFDEDKTGGMSLSEDDIIVEKMLIHHGMRDKDPVSRLRFYSKSQCDQKESYGRPAKEDTYSMFFPRELALRAIRVFCRRKAVESIAFEAADLWTKSNDCINLLPDKSIHDGYRLKDDSP